MRLTIGFVLALALSIPAEAVDFRWGSSTTMGTTEAIIANENGSTLNIYCPAGQIDKTPGMFVHVDKVRPRAGEKIDVQIVIEGESHAFILDEIQWEANGRARMNNIYSLVKALTNASEPSFIIEFPKFGMSERFSLLDARKTLGSPGKFLRDCN